MRTRLSRRVLDADVHCMDPSRDERRLLEIQHKISVLGHRDAFNLDMRRAALAKLEVTLAGRVAESHA